LAPKIAKAEALLDWGQAAPQLERRVRAFDPWPVAETRLSDGRRLRVFEAVALAGEPAAPAGTVLAAGRAGIDVAAGAGVLRLLRIQPPAGRVMDAEAYLAAHSLSGVAFVA
jgi:methionyl-tRNA formyltransferase